MATIPLPALDIKPQGAPPDLLGEYGKLMQIKQQQAMAPLQQQLAQQQIQGGQLDLESKQRAAADAKAMQATMEQWGKPGQVSSPPGNQQNWLNQGGKGTYDPGITYKPQTSDIESSPSAVSVPSQSPLMSGSSQTSSKSSMPSYDDLVPLAIKNGASFQSVQALDTHVKEMKNKAASTDKDTADAMKVKNGLITDAISGVMQAPDDQLPQQIQSAAQELASKGLFDPEHVQQAMQVPRTAQTNPAQA